MSDNTELMLILMEECAEVQQAISKVFRFGKDAVYQDKTNTTRLEEEIGDLLCCIDLLKLTGLISSEEVQKNKQKKLEKLKRWSTIDLPDKLE